MNSRSFHFAQVHACAEKICRNKWYVLEGSGRSRNYVLDNLHPQVPWRSKSTAKPERKHCIYARIGLDLFGVSIDSRSVDLAICFLSLGLPILGDVFLYHLLQATFQFRPVSQSEKQFQPDKQWS